MLSGQDRNTNSCLSFDGTTFCLLVARTCIYIAVAQDKGVSGVWGTGWASNVGVKH